MNCTFSPVSQFVMGVITEICLCVLISTPESKTEEQYSISIFHINNIYMYLVKDVYMVFLTDYCLHVKLLSLPVPANNQTDTVQISIVPQHHYFFGILCGLISAAPFLQI